MVYTQVSIYIDENPITIPMDMGTFPFDEVGFQTGIAHLISMNNRPRPRRVERKPRGGVKASPKMDPRSITDASLEGNQAGETVCFVKSAG